MIASPTHSPWPLRRRDLPARMPRCATVAALLLSAALCGCAIGPRSLAEERLSYNEVVKSTSEQQLLLNIVRLRYTDTPSSLAISSIATQYELMKSLGLTPLFGVAGGDSNVTGRGTVLPGGSVSLTERPTVTLTPLDDQDFTRKLFTPMTLEGVLYLAKTTWPIETVFRLWLENLNWVSNAETASGPTARDAPQYARFLAGVQSLQALQDRGFIVFSNEERFETVGSPLPVDQMTPDAMLGAAKEGYEYRSLPNKGGWVLRRKTLQPVMRVDPQALKTPEMAAFVTAFRLKPGVSQYDIGVERLHPFPESWQDGAASLDLETRSLLQVLYFMSKGVEVPAADLQAGLAQQSQGDGGEAFDWHRVTDGLFRVQSTDAAKPPPTAHVAVRYLGHWFYVDKRDRDSMSTFALMMELARLELGSKDNPGPTLTLPLSGR